MRKLENSDLVKDSIQDLFVKLWTNRRNLGATSNIKYYLLTAMKHRLIDLSLAPVTTQLDLAGPGEAFRMEFSADSEYLRREQNNQQIQSLLAALDQLTGRQKEIIYLRFFEELSYDEIAVMMDISVKGAYKLSYRALDALKEILKISRKDLLLLLLLCKMAT